MCRGMDVEIDRYIDTQSEMDEGEERHIGCADHKRGTGDDRDDRTLWSVVYGNSRHPLDNGFRQADRHHDRQHLTFEDQSDGGHALHIMLAGKH